MVMLPVAVHTPVAGSYSSALAKAGEVAPGHQHLPIPQ